ncbi:MAG TPA: hypothetical protein VJM50_22140 [Pyrinomonadaceae bacterium]|nr:hypothetical protein [Pyrinomonadaceae bacterium]
MLTRTRILLLVSVVIALLLIAWVALARNCPSAGIALTVRARDLHRLKNRTTLPQASDFDSAVTLDALLQPGDDRTRWSSNRAARIQGEVVDVGYAGTEAANCFSPSRRDIHIDIATRKGAAKNQKVVLEVTPPMREWARQQGMDWSAETLHAQLVGRWCEFEGWLYFDVGHAEEAENTAPKNPENWRATAWEIHPITKITVIR